MVYEDSCHCSRVSFFLGFEYERYARLEGTSVNVTVKSALNS